MSDVSMADSIPAEDLPALPPMVMGAAIAAIVLGVLGFGAGIIQFILLLAGGAFATFAMFSQITEPMVMWSIVSIIMQLLIVLVGWVLSIVGGVSGAIGLMRRKVSLLKWAALTLVIFDVLAHLVWPVLNVVINAAIQFSVMGGDAMAAVLVGLPGLVVGIIWSLVLAVVWGAVYVITMRYKPVAELQ